MRLWSIHPQYLDTKGLLAAWREGLLAQHVLAGKTKGYKNHPQLNRFKSAKDPLNAIGVWLLDVWKEANHRGYQFNREKILKTSKCVKIGVTSGQVQFERQHLLKKLKIRDPERYKSTLKISEFRTHPIFKEIKGSIEPWEIL